MVAGREVFPRCAGVDRVDSGSRPFSARFPPVRGGGPLATDQGAVLAAFSPGARGWTAA